MNLIIRPKNWEELQHYKHRSPPWIKLHKSLLDNYEFQCLQDASKALAMCLWLLASERDGGVIDAASDKLAFRLRTTTEKIDKALKPLIDDGFFIVVQDASNTLAECKQDALTEKSRDREEKSTSSEYSDEFITFWKEYPKKVGKDKANQLWKKLHPPIKEVLTALSWQRSSKTWQDGYVPNPETYLNQGRWKDEPTDAVSKTDPYNLGKFI